VVPEPPVGGAWPGGHFSETCASFAPPY